MRHPLARALATVGLDSTDVASRLGVDPKTVDRWFTGRVPYPRYRHELARLTGWTERDLWPDAAPREPEPAATEVRLTYAHRSAVQPDTWHRLFQSAEHAIDVITYSGLFLAEDPAVQRIFREKAACGVHIRIGLGDPEGKHVAARGADEGINDVMCARIHNALVLLRPLTRAPGIELRLHDTVLYNSIYRADYDMLINAHVYGAPAAHTPVLSLRRTDSDGMAATYLDSIERIWATARQVD